jgi:hypothetical protein
MKKECCICFLDVQLEELRLLSPCGHRCVCGDCGDALVKRRPPRANARSAPSKPVVFATRVYDI